MNSEKLQAWVKQPAFWLYFISVMCSGIAVHPAIPESWRVIVGAVATACMTVAGPTNAYWNPPRRPWTNEERIARGLPPVPNGTGEPKA